MVSGKFFKGQAWETHLSPWKKVRKLPCFYFEVLLILYQRLKFETFDYHAILVIHNVKKMLGAAIYNLYHDNLYSKFLEILKDFQRRKFRNIGKFRKTQHSRVLVLLSL